MPMFAIPRAVSYWSFLIPIDIGLRRSAVQPPRHATVVNLDAAATEKVPALPAKEWGKNNSFPGRNIEKTFNDQRRNPKILIGISLCVLCVCSLLTDSF